MRLRLTSGGESEVRRSEITSACDYSVQQETKLDLETGRLSENGQTLTVTTTSSSSSSCVKGLISVRLKKLLWYRVKPTSEKLERYSLNSELPRLQS